MTASLKKTHFKTLVSMHPCIIKWIQVPFWEKSLEKFAFKCITVILENLIVVSCKVKNSVKATAVVYAFLLGCKFVKKVKPQVCKYKKSERFDSWSSSFAVSLIICLTSYLTCGLVGINFKPSINFVLISIVLSSLIWGS